MPTGVYKRSKGQKYGTKGYKHTEKAKRKISEATKGKNNPFYGKKHSEESKRKISETGKNRTAWNKGKHYSENDKKNMFGKKHSEETRKKMSERMKGKILSETTRKKISEATKGYKHPMYGKHQSKEAKRKMSETKTLNISIDEFINNLKNAFKYEGKISKKQFKENLKKRKVCCGQTLLTKLKNNNLNLDDLANLADVEFKRVTPAIGTNETELLDKYEIDNNIKLKRQYSSGKYFIDGYDPINNIAVEIDETHHYIKGKLRTEDIIRQKRIEDLLGCGFVRIKDEI